MSKDTLLTTVVVGGIFLLSLALVITASEQEEEQAAIAKQLAYEKWSQNDLFINTLERYNEIYHRLREPHEKEALALAYMKMLTHDLFLFPSKGAEQVTLNVLLPMAKETEDVSLGHKSFVMQQIYIGPDNGLYDALRYLIDGRKGGVYQPPPYWSSQTGQLLTYVKTGQGPVMVTPIQSGVTNLVENTQNKTAELNVKTD